MLSVLVVALVASVPGSPLQPLLVPGGEPSGPIHGLAALLGVDSLSSSGLVAASVVATALAAGAFLWILAEAWRRRISLRSVVILVVAYHVVLIFLPVLFSRDVYSYAAYGRIAVHGGNPYVQTPGAYPNDPVTAFVSPMWIDVPAVYGPLFTSFAAGITSVVEGLAAQVNAFRLAAIASSLSTALLIGWVARRRFRPRAAFAVAAFGLNPVVLFQSAGGGHNDLFLALAVAVAVALLVDGRDAFAVLALALGALVKVSAGLPLLLLLVWLVARRPAGERLRAALGYAGITAGMALLAAAPFLQPHDPSLGMVELAGHEGWLAPSRLFAKLLDAVSGDTIGIVARIAFAVLLFVVVAALVRFVGSRGAGAGLVPTEADRFELAGAWGWSLVLLMLLGPVLLPWYVTWALPVLWLLPHVPRVVLIATSTALGLSQWTAEPRLHPKAYDVNVLVGHYAIAPLVALLLVWLLLELRHRLRNDLPLAGPLVLEEPAPVEEPARGPAGDR